MPDAASDYYWETCLELQNNWQFVSASTEAGCASKDHAAYQATSSSSEFKDSSAKGWGHPEISHCSVTERASDGTKLCEAGSQSVTR